MTRYFVLYFGWTLDFIPTVWPSGSPRREDRADIGLWTAQAPGFVHQRRKFRTMRASDSHFVVDAATDTIIIDMTPPVQDL